MNRTKSRDFVGNSPYNNTSSLPEASVTNTPTRLLIADDDSISRLLMVRVLENHLPGLQILQAGNGREALQTWQRHRPPIVLMDLQMPHLSGHEVAAAIRTSEARAAGDTPSHIIIVSGSCCSEIHDSCREHRVSHLLEKPVEPRLLIEAVRSCLDSRIL